MSLEVSVTGSDAGPVILRLRGTLSTCTVDWCLDAVDSAILSGHTDVVINLSQLALVEPTAVEALEDARAAVEQYGGSLRVTSDPSSPSSTPEAAPPWQEGDV